VPETQARLESSEWSRSPQGQSTSRACVDEDVAIRAPVTALHPTDAEQTVLAYVRLTSAPRTADLEDIRRSFRVPNRYLPPGGEEIVAPRLRGGGQFTEVGRWFTLSPNEEWRRKGIEEWGRLCSNLASMSSAERALQLLRTAGGLDVHYSSVEQMTPHDQIEVEELEDLSGLARGIDVNEFVRKLEGRTVRLANINNERGIELTTIHGAKGREWESVVLFGANADQLPHFRTLATTETQEGLEEALEDERRLAYVAMTRAKRALS
jgi:superfamily I DNA/RNA helicase